MLLLFTGCADKEADFSIALTPEQLDWVGQKIFQNECSGKESCLVHWNEGEAFPSLGIGHFIWYPAGVDEPFVESFPLLIDFMHDNAVSLPTWMDELESFDAPWPDRPTFLDRQDSTEIWTLRKFLVATQGVQAEFMYQRARESMQRVLDAVPEDQQDRLRRKLTAITRTPGGVYALIDYVNFKGEGLSAKETYQGQGWGLLQVLQQMPEDFDSKPLQRFQQAAVKVLTRRAENAENPIEREKWLPGWINRLKTYRDS
ncbi:hypothetical protein [Hahella sp. CCB-MM4]|uniref:hypothetical protein n=1 Tax=Hahella sp. (strain CCB-MM4) TaxID=1926491 RepID=UPI000B9AB5C3|nr:hypothetical protein [Hahella sp. CCB-MM4]